MKIDSEDYYKISNYDQMRPFFISLVSHCDLWLFISTTGGVSAGRRNEDSALFPYYTDDKISDSYDTTGSKSLLRVHKGEKTFLWEPFSNRYGGAYQIRRNLYKNVTGNKLIFEEVNEDLGITFRYSWQFSDRFGLVKRSEVTNLTDNEVTVEVLDGIQNIIPYGVSPNLQNVRSNLANAYKRNELESKSGLGIFALSSMIVDKAEPSEALKATTVWGGGIDMQHILLSSFQLDLFRQGNELSTEHDIKAEPGSYFINGTLNISPNHSSTWFIVGEVNQDHSDVINTIGLLSGSREQVLEGLKDDIESGTKALKHLVGLADGLQLTNDKLSIGRHYSNTLFNIMRGGIFDDQYLVSKDDLIDYVNTINVEITKSGDFFEKLNDELDYNDLIDKAKSTKDPDVIRICYEYLPLTFSRRHGDPSRPWNQFSIQTRREDGSKIKNYEGNWRDIFQNWEALGLSFPAFLTSMITKFVNASTLDGYNPYRITREGIDWEVIEPDDPWSYIGYWGDHQIIYLLKLMELASNHNHDAFIDLLSRNDFVYANVPYRIKSYKDIVLNPQDTIDFDDEEELRVEERMNALGSDGKLVFNKKNGLTRANLTEKLLVTLLAKISNFVPEAGIWLNTQRPEWNDANNALVGNGVSMVTLYYMRRFVTFCRKLFSENEVEGFELNKSVFDLFNGIHKVLNNYSHLLTDGISDPERKSIVDELGILGETYRNQAYSGFSGEKIVLNTNELVDFLDLSLRYIDQSIEANRRDDGLYHAYNLIQFEGSELKVDYLYEMLEGQVAVLSSGMLDPDEALNVLDFLKSSAIFREDQFSYMLYPNRDLPKFLEKNELPDNFVRQSVLATAMLEASDNSIIHKDENGKCHFNGNFNNADSLRVALDNLKADEQYGELVNKEYDDFLNVFEDMFNHKAFTGRSGTFFGFEGLGSIYWHMVSKLLLAVQENIYWMGNEFTNTPTLGRMIDHYYEIRAGIGINKSPDLYGAFPTDPYSHTPGNKGAQQPGMTGQVKEDVINRWAELGVHAIDGKIVIHPKFLHIEEFMTEPSEFEYFDTNGESKNIALDKGQLVFTYCQVPIIFQKSSDQGLTIYYKDDRTVELDSNVISQEVSEQIFNRTGEIAKIICKLSIG